MDISKLFRSPEVPAEKFPILYVNVMIMNYTELRLIRAQLSHLMASSSSQPEKEIDQYYTNEGEKIFDETWASLLAKMGE